MKNKINYIAFIALLLALFVACDNDNNEFLEDAEEQEVLPSSDKYLLMTYDKTTIPAGPMAGQVLMNSYISYFSELPTGSAISNIVASNTLKGYIGENGGGLLQLGNNVYRCSNSATSQSQLEYIYNTPTRLLIPNEGLIRELAFRDLEINGISLVYKNFAINGDTGALCLNSKQKEGSAVVYFFDALTMNKIQVQFMLSRKPYIENIIAEIVGLTPEMAGVNFPYVSLGMNFCEFHNDKLIVDVELLNEDQINISSDVYLLAIEPKQGGGWSSVSLIEDTGLIGSASESRQHCHDENGDLYILTKGGDLFGFYQNSKISRIKKGADTVDKDWELRIGEMSSSKKPKRFNGIFVAKNKIITLINNAELSSASKDMNLENVWDYYVIDIDTKKFEKIGGLQSCSGFVSGANLVSEIDGKYYIRYVRTGDNAPYNGYYEYDFATNKATPVLNVKEGGYVVDLKKITNPTN